MPVSLPSFSGSSQSCTGLFQRQLQLPDGFEATLQNRFHAPTDQELRRRIGFLAISVRNPRFSNALIASFCRAVSKHFAGGVVTVVDRPYEHNVAAGGGTHEEQRREIQTLRRIAVETQARVARIVAKHGGSVSTQSWDALAAETPDWLVRNIRAAWKRGGRFHADVLAQCRAVLPNMPGSDGIERYAEFFLEELPVLLHRYYFCSEEIVDVYPGPQPAVFWRIEAGAYGDEMPELTDRLCVRAGLVYAQVWVRIRPMRPKELETVMSIWQRSREQDDSLFNNSVNGAAEEERRCLDSIGRRNGVWVAAEGIQILGFLAILGSHVSHLCVDPFARRRGVGTALLKQAKILSPEGLTLFSHERSETARAFCTRERFHEIRLAGNTVAKSEPQLEFVWKPGPHS